MSSRHTNQQTESRRDRALNTSPSEADHRKLHELEIALAKAKRELEVFCQETNQTSSLLPVEQDTEHNMQDRSGPDITDNLCHQCGCSYETNPISETQPRRTIRPGVSCEITRVMDATGDTRTRYTNTTAGGRNDGEWCVGSHEGGYMGAQISGSMDVLADRIREDEGCTRVLFSLIADEPERFARVLMNHTQMRRVSSSGYDLDTGEPAI